MANRRVSPQAITPGIDSIPAHQRPSSSGPTMIGMDSGAAGSVASREADAAALAGSGREQRFCPTTGAFAFAGADGMGLRRGAGGVRDGSGFE
jgi:hypothetical protein